MSKAILEIATRTDTAICYTVNTRNNIIRSSVVHTHYNIKFMSVIKSFILLLKPNSKLSLKRVE